jgi:hypothetical protein
MSVRVWNTLARRKEDLEPLDPPPLRLFEATGASSRWYRKVRAEPRPLQASRSQVRT